MTLDRSDYVVVFFATIVVVGILVLAVVFAVSYEEPEGPPDIEPQALAWCDGHDGDLVMLEPDGEPEPYCVLPTGDAVPLMDRVEVAG